jgi:hypothetical protein
MRRLILIFGMFLTLTAGVWSSVPVAAASCPHEASAPDASAGHDCCRANAGEPDTSHFASQGSSHEEAAHVKSNTLSQAHGAPARTHCADASAAPEIDAVALGQGGLLLSSCADCCAGDAGQTPATAFVAAPEPNKVKRVAGSDAACALFARAPSYISHLAPSQHAPPAPPARRHILLGLFLI